jgi:hypothetical protein
VKQIIKILEYKLKPEYMNSIFTWHQLVNALEECYQSDLIMIKIDKIPFYVKPIITFSQLKRMIGADNSHYKIECINKPERWGNKEPSEDEFLDLSQSDCRNLEFKCVRKNILAKRMNNEVTMHDLRNDDQAREERNPGPTGHGPDICYSDADPGL